MKAVLNVVVLISGRGSNLKAILDARDPLIAVRAVISNRADATGLFHAQVANIPTAVLEHAQFANREAFDNALSELIDSFAPDVVVLAGFMRILSPAFVQHYAGRLINIHPSLLPEFKGLNTHQRVLEAGCRYHGATVHYVTEELDSGAILAQAQLEVLAEDTPDSLAARVLTLEHQLYPMVLRRLAEDKLNQ